MKIKSLGTQGLTASEMGLGCMGMSDFYGSQNDDESIKTIHSPSIWALHFSILQICMVLLKMKF